MVQLRCNHTELDSVWILPVCLSVYLSVSLVLRPLQSIQDSGVLQVSLVEPAAVFQVGSDVVQVVWSSGADHVISQDHRALSQKTTILQGGGQRSEHMAGLEVRCQRSGVITSSSLMSRR